MTTDLDGSEDPLEVDIVARLMGLDDHDFDRLAKRDRTYLVWRDPATGAIRSKKRDIRDFRPGRLRPSIHRDRSDQPSAARPGA